MAYHESDQSVFNMAMAYLKRIDKLLYFCQEAAMYQNIDSWLNHLRAVRRELSVKLKEEAKEGETSEEKELKDMFIEVSKLLNAPGSRKNNRPQILAKLDEIDIWMRKKLQEKGMLLPNRADPRFAVLER